MKKILVVEDNLTNMYLICYIIEQMGHQPIKALTGEEGVEMAFRDRPDLILMDIQLPGIDGLEAIQRIRASNREFPIPIIAITSYAMTGDRERLLAAGCNGYLEKPINSETIIDELNVYLTETNRYATAEECKDRPMAPEKSNESLDC
ncbi:MAG: two-component system, cell cycle response regulator DivK [Thermodesulfobacteriota bacterium]|nr:two-component system, cell cycle response regulator DivK [Thermodesulfobacteriota bacterium]